MIRCGKLRILLIEDNPTEALLIGEGLAELDEFAHELVRVERLSEGVDASRASRFDVVLLDLGLPGYTGIETFREFQKQQPDVPVLVLTGLEDTQVSLLALHEGAQDYVIKRDIQSSVLGRAIRYAVERHRLGRQLERSLERLRMLTVRQQNVREQERVRISRELHDELGQKMSALKMDMSWVETRLRAPPTTDSIPAVQDRVLVALQLADNVIESVQRLAFELRPSALDHLGLTGAIREESRRFEARTGIRMRLLLPDDLKIGDTEFSTMFFRVFQELLTNVARHAKAGDVSVRFAETDGELLMQVADDGIGLPPGALESNTSLGLLGMQERVAAQNGRITFESSAAEGTTVSVSVPADQAAGGISA